MSYRILRAAVVAASLSAVLAGPALAADAKDPVVVTVNGKDIRLSAVKEAYQNSQYRQVPFEMVFPQVVDYVVTGQLLLDQAKKAGTESDPQVKAAVKQAQDQIVEKAFLVKKVDAEVTEADVKALYELQKQKEEVHARHILVDSEDAAKQIITDLKGGAKFEDEAKAKTQDPSGKENGGDLGFFTADAMVPEVSQVAFSLKPGEYSQVPVHTQFGWHVIKVEGRRTAQVRPYEEIKATLATEVKQHKAQAYIESLQKGADVKRFNADGTPATAKAPAAAAPAADDAKQ